jgi:hypothetical protein
MRIAIAISLAMCLASPTLALDRGVDRDVAFVTGGVGLEEREEIARWEHAFNVKIVTATRQSGAYVANVHIDVHRGEILVFDRTMDGPWMLLKLTPGQYVLTGNANGVLRRQAMSVPRTGRIVFTLQWEDAETETRGIPGSTSAR